MLFKRPEGLTAQVQAYEYLRAGILDRRLPSGVHLNPTEVAERLGCSRIPVREAIRQLEGEGLVTIKPNRRAVVTILSSAEVRELFEMRAVLEAFAARQATSRITPEGINELDMLRCAMDAARGDARSWTEAHSRFHDYLALQSERPRLLAEIARLRTAVQPYLLMYIDVYESTEMTGYEHGTLIDAIRTGNSSLVEVTMRDHVMSAAQGIIDWLQARERQAA